MNSELRVNEAESFNEALEVTNRLFTALSMIRYLLYRLTYTNQTNLYFFYNSVLSSFIYFRYVSFNTVSKRHYF